VLLEDIDAVGIKRQAEMTEDGDDDDDFDDKPNRSRCTLSGVLNVLDGVASQEGRIVLMTSNMAHKLDKALVRPGRIDKMIFLDCISQRSAELMFLRMYTPDVSHANPYLDLKEGELHKLALEFGRAIPDNTFTPAQLQGYLLNHRNSPALAATEMSSWVAEEQTKMEEARAHAKKVAEWRAKRRNRRTMELLAKRMESADHGVANDAVVKEGANENAEKESESTESSGAIVNGEAKEKESKEMPGAIVNGETNCDAKEDGLVQGKGEQRNGDSRPEKLMIATEKETAGAAEQGVKVVENGEITPK
jgi:chaperone BCS1